MEIRFYPITGNMAKAMMGGILKNGILTAEEVNYCYVCSRIRRKQKEGWEFM